MPTFTAIALDRLLEPVAPKSLTAAENVTDSKVEMRNNTSNSRRDMGSNGPLNLEKQSSLPSTTTERKNVSSTMTVDRKNHWTQISPALYATPKSTPLPDSPSSFPPSPYIINHKRRGPRLLKSFSEDDVATSQRALDKQKADENAQVTQMKIVSADDSSIPGGTVDPGKADGFISVYGNSDKEEDRNDSFHLVKEDNVNGSSNVLNCDHASGACDGEILGSKMANGSSGQSDAVKCVTFNLQQIAEVDNFLDPQDSVSVQSNVESDANGGLEQSLNLPMPVAEFYDAWEELSSESGPQPPVPDIEAELREIRLSLLMEIEKRKQAEEALNNMKTEWQRICNQLSSVGLALPADPLTVSESEHLDGPAEDLCRQVYLARLVSNAIGRATAKAEVEMEMEAQLELKHFEIARLSDRLHYYETVNHEMSQRNQEAVDMARRLRRRRKKKLRWIWGSAAVAIILGSAFLAWSYFSTGEDTSSSNHSLVSEGEHPSE